MNYLQDTNHSPTAANGQHEQMDAVLRPAEHRLPLGNDSTTNGMPYGTLPDVANPIPSWPSMPGRMTDNYSSSNHSTPLSSDMKSPQSVRTTATPEHGNKLMPVKRSNSTTDEPFFTDSAGNFDANRMPRNVPIPTYNTLQRHSSTGPIKAAQQQQTPHITDSRSSRSVLNPPTSTTSYRPPPTSNYAGAPAQNGYSYPQTQPAFLNDGYSTQPNYPPSMSLPPPVYPAGPQTLSQNSQVMITEVSNQMPASETASNMNIYSTGGVENSFFDPGGTSHSIPPYDLDGHSRSPLAMADDFTAWLFNEPPPQSSSPGGHRPGHMSVGSSAFDDFAIPSHGQYGFPGDMTNGYIVPQQHPMAVTSILDPASEHAVLSEEKRAELIVYLENHFTDYAFKDKKEAILNGDRDLDSHVLSLRSLQNYIGSYWYHFHPQMPILHKPTFSADSAQNLLLCAIICIGASCLDKMHGPDVTQAGAEFSNFLAWHLRGEIFKHGDFLPPARLWVFQTLLLLEIYEKMYSDRKLHERAHIHHATTLTLMRRGSSLIGRSTLDSPPTIQDEKTGLMVPADLSTSLSKDPEGWWNSWINNEATRRVAFAAFIVDSIHATMFGHGATMVAHEMKLALPCDESLWLATSSAEVSRIESKLQAQGTKTMTFFEGLKDTLKGKPVRTNPFGRTAIMAGLLSVTWHMNQRDVQIHHLGALKALGGKDIWRGPLTKAFDSWKYDFNQSLGSENLNASYASNRLDDDTIIFESRTVLHHLAHMAMHVDIVSCQIFAKATRLLGRTTLPSDYEIAQKRIRLNWAPRASARHATFYALKFLRQVLILDSAASYRGSHLGGSKMLCPYSARDDFLLNRPWVLYYAVLVVWSYGYALDGPLMAPPPLLTPEQQHDDMKAFLNRVGGIQDPRELERTEQRNSCLGLLYVLREKFKQCRWELLREAATLLDNCIKMLRGSA